MDGSRFLKNQWYAAATSAELAAAPLGRRICGEALVLFRRKDRSIAVLEDRCPHRKFPLSRGTMVNGELQCGYHGFRFNGHGACTLIPSQDTIPPQVFDARAFAAAERHALVFVWMGDSAEADLSLLPDFHENDSPGWIAGHGYIHVKANYQLVIDNLLDLTHLTFVHKTTLSGPGIVENPLRMELDGDVVRARRDMYNVDPAPIHGTIRKFTGKIDRYQEFEFHAPGYIHLNLGANPAGSNEDRSIPHHVVMNSLTPETEQTTHYFWSIAHCRIDADPAASRKIFEINKAAFDEDLAILEAQQRAIDSDPSGRPLGAVAGDQAVAMARRVIARKLAQQS